MALPVIETNVCFICEKSTQQSHRVKLKPVGIHFRTCRRGSSSLLLSVDVDETILLTTDWMGLMANLVSTSSLPIFSHSPTLPPPLSTPYYQDSSSPPIHFKVTKISFSFSICLFMLRGVVTSISHLISTFCWSRGLGSWPSSALLLPKWSQNLKLLWEAFRHTVGARGLEH